MKRSNKNVAPQSSLQFPSVTHDAPRLALLVNRRMRNGTAYTTVNKSGLVFSGFRIPQRKAQRKKLVFCKNPLNIKEHRLSDKPGDLRYFPAYMSDAVKVRLLASEFIKELPCIVSQLSAHCTAIIEQQSMVQMAWPARYIHAFKKWVRLVKRIEAKIEEHGENLNDPAAFSRVLMRGNVKPVIVDFILKYRARYDQRKFSRLVQQFFL